jgi:hypothetical protein
VLGVAGVALATAKALRPSGANASRVSSIDDIRFSDSYEELDRARPRPLPTHTALGSDKRASRQGPLGAGLHKGVVRISRGLNGLLA